MSSDFTRESSILTAVGYIGGFLIVTLNAITLHQVNYINIINIINNNNNNYLLVNKVFVYDKIN
jgi:hypothetical protein